MNLVDFVALLKSTGYSVAYSHFETDGDNPPPPLPFITYITPSTDNFMADNRVYHKVTDVDVELYTRNKDLVAEEKLESIFDDHEIPYNATQVWIEEEKVFQKLYELRLI